MHPLTFYRQLVADNKQTLLTWNRQGELFFAAGSHVKDGISAP